MVWGGFIYFLKRSSKLFEEVERQQFNPKPGSGLRPRTSQDCREGAAELPEPSRAPAPKRLRGPGAAPSPGRSCIIGKPRAPARRLPLVAGPQAPPASHPPLSPCGAEGQEAESIWPRGSPSPPAGSLLHRARPELISFLLGEVLAYLLENWLLEISCLDLCLLFWTGGMSWAPVSWGT